MKSLFLVFFLTLWSSANAQLIEGAIVNDGRQILGEPAYIVEGMKDGWAKFELAVDINGNVTGISMLESNLKSTPATTIIRNHVKKFKFEPGTYFPKHHQVVVKITMVKGKVEDPQIEFD
mgnify:CR=1 FL=1